MRSKKKWDIYGTAPDGEEYLLAVAYSVGVCYMIMDKLRESYTKLRAA